MKKSNFKKAIAIILSVTMLLSVGSTALSVSAAEVNTASSVSATSGDFEYELRGDGTAMITNYVGSATDVVIPDKIGGCKIAVISMYAFSGCDSVVSVYIPDGVESIVYSAFSDCSQLKKIHIPDTVTSIGYGAFSGCESLEEITLPKNIKKLDHRMFIGCSQLKKISIPYGVTEIGYMAFGRCDNLTTVEIPDTVTYIDEETFIDCPNLKEVVLPASVTTIRHKSMGFINTHEYEEDVEENYVPIEGFVIYGYKGTAAEEYAKDNELKFIALDDVEKDTDVSGDGVVDVGDVTALQMLLANYDIKVNTQALDVNNDDNVDVTDVTTLQMILAGYDI